jgi:hypothetical protein
VTRPTPAARSRRSGRAGFSALLVTLALSACGSTVATTSAPAGATGPGVPGALGEATAPQGGPGAVDPVTGAPLDPDTGLPAGTPGGATGSGGAAPTGGGSGDSSGGPAAAPGRTTTGDTGAKKPILVGLFAADYTKLVKSVGGSSSTSDPHAVNRALVKALNAKGGLAGRRIDPIYQTLDGTATDYTSQEQAACEAFTKDNKTEVVISAGVGSETFYGCLLKAAVPLVTGNPTEGTDRATLRQYPNVFNPPGMTTDRQAIAFIEQSIRTKWLTKDNNVGVLLSGCPWGKRTYDGVVVPRLQRLGAEVSTFSIGCPAKGSGELGATSSAAQNAVLQFRSAGVDRVMILTGHGDAASYIMFTNNAESQGWRPGYIVGSNAVAQAWVQQGVVSREQARNTRGAGWIPVVDMANAPLSPEGKACEALVRAGDGPTPAAKGQFNLFCDAWLSLRQALESNGGQGGLSALRPALEGLGTSFVSAGNIRGAVRLGPQQHDGAALVAPTAYVDSCSCFQYTADPQPVE